MAAAAARQSSPFELGAGSSPGHELKWSGLCLPLPTGPCRVQDRDPTQGIGARGSGPSRRDEELGMSVPREDESSRNKRTAKRILAIGLPFVLLTGVGIGYAYWTSAGAGAGTATAAPGVTNAGLSAVVSGLVPGGTVTVPVTVSNPNATTSIAVS